MDDIRLCASSTSPVPQILCITETWLHCAVTDDFASIANYVLYRDDRVGRRGGGVAVWVADYLNCECIASVYAKPNEIDCLFLYFYKLNFLLVAIYIPPVPASSVSMYDVIANFIINSVDDFLIRHPFCDIFLCGDLNRFNVTELCQDLSFTNIVNEPTLVGGNATLDFVLLSDRLLDYYTANVESPIADSDHKSIRCCPSTIVTNKHFLSVLFMTFEIQMQLFLSIVFLISIGNF